MPRIKVFPQKLISRHIYSNYRKFEGYDGALVEAIVNISALYHDV